MPEQEKEPAENLIKENKINFSDQIDFYVKISAVSALAFVILGYANLQFYYSFFDIKVSKYLETSEIALSFISTYFDFIAVTIGIVAVFFFVDRKEKLINKKQKIIPVKKKGGRLHRFLDSLSYQVIITAMLSALIVIGYLYTLYSVKVQPQRPLEIFDDLRPFGIILKPIFYIFLPGVVSMLWVVLIKENLKLGKLFFFSTMFVFTILYLGIHSYRRYKLVTKNMGVQVKLIMKDNGEINSSSDLIFIDATRGFYFFRDTVTQTNRIIPANEVIEEQLCE